eukprot:4466695-Pleurochrysis_carterae.AAC.1
MPSAVLGALAFLFSRHADCSWLGSLCWSGASRQGSPGRFRGDRNYIIVLQVNSLQSSEVYSIVCAANLLGLYT